MADALATPQHRLMISGASNVSMLLDRILGATQARLDGPVEFHMACAFGRSYVVKTPHWRHRLPAITKSGLLQLPEQFDGTTYSLLTDVGNDIFVGISNQKILESVRLVLEKMLESSHKVAITELPVGPAERISPLTYRLFKTLLFRHSDITLDRLLNVGRELNSGMNELAQELGVACLRFETQWYRPDAIHFRKRHADKAVAACLTAMGLPEKSTFAPPVRISRRELKHQLRYRAGAEVVAPQPGCALPDGSTVFLY